MGTRIVLDVIIDEDTYRVYLLHMRVNGYRLINIHAEEPFDIDLPIQDEFDFECNCGVFDVDTVFPAGTVSMIVAVEADSEVDRVIGAKFRDIIADLEGSQFEHRMNGIVAAHSKRQESA